MRACTEFPPYDSFKTCLKGDVDKNVYNKNKAEFDRRIALPDGHNEKWSNFVDYLRYYNGKLIFSNLTLIILKFNFRVRCQTGIHRDDEPISDPEEGVWFRANGNEWPSCFRPVCDV